MRDAVSMKSPLFILAGGLLVLRLAPCGWSQEIADTTLVKKSHHVLFFSKSAGFEHSVIKRTDDAPGHVEKVLAELGPANNIKWTFTKDGSVFTPENIATYDAFVFYTTGDLTKDTGDKSPPMTPAGKTALLEAIKNGKGFVGTHSASDTFHTVGSAYQSNDATTIDPYIAMLGGEFIVHNAQQKAKLTCVDPIFPGMAGVKDGVEMVEEWYSLKNFAPDLHVLLVQQTDGMTGNAYQRPPYPETWARMEGRGRVFFTSMAHREDTWLNPAFQKVLLGGIRWAVGEAEADVTPNLKEVCPGAGTMPPAK